MTEPRSKLESGRRWPASGLERRRVGNGGIMVEVLRARGSSLDYDPGVEEAPMSVRL